MKNLILLKSDSLLLSIISIIYGFQLVISPEIFDQYKVYELVSRITSATLLGSLFLLIGLLKLIGVFINYKLMKRLSLTALTLLWTMLWVLFALSSVNNTINLLPFSMAWLSIIIAVREVY